MSNKVFIAIPWVGVGGNGLKSSTGSLLKHEHCRSCHLHKTVQQHPSNLEALMNYDPAAHKGQMKQ